MSLLLSPYNFLKYTSYTQPNGSAIHVGCNKIFSTLKDLLHIFIKSKIKNVKCVFDMAFAENNFQQSKSKHASSVSTYIIPQSEAQKDNCRNKKKNTVLTGGGL